VKAVIVIPAFNESAVVYKVLKSLPKKMRGITHLETVVVNDGSTDSTSVEIKKNNVNQVNHRLNRGVGAATKTGIEWAKRNDADIVVTFDADGQHHPDDIEKVIRPIILNRADLVIGSRFKKKQNIPFDRLLINWFANFATLFLFGVLSTDSQSGLRAMSKRAMESIDIRSDRMEFSSEVLLEARRHRLKIKEVPIKAIYTNYSRLKGQPNTNAFPIMARFLVKFLR